MRGANALTRRTNGPLLQKPSPQGYAFPIYDRGSRLRVKQNLFYPLVFHREDNSAGMSCLFIDLRQSRS